MKTMFVCNGIVTGYGTGYTGSPTTSTADPASMAYSVDDESPVDIGWTCVVTDGVPVFTAPTTPTHALLAPMQFYLAFTPTERKLIKALAGAGIPVGSTLVTPSPTTAIPADADVAEFWATYELAVQLNDPVNPNLTSIQEGLAYLANPTAPTPAVIAAARIPQILAGVAQ